MKKRFIVIIAAGLAGCGPLAGIQADLVTQGREGLRRVELARQREAEAVAAFLVERRARMDDAFDRDVRGRAATTLPAAPGDGRGLNPDWVIAARQAYAVGLDALAEAKARHDSAARSAADNAAAADEALGPCNTFFGRRNRSGPHHPTPLPEKESKTMTAEDIKHAVENQVHALWNDFASQHAGLAAELERGDYIGAALDVLRNEPAFKAAMSKGALADAATTSVLGVVEKVVRTLMRI